MKSNWMKWIALTLAVALTFALGTGLALADGDATATASASSETTPPAAETTSGTEGGTQTTPPANETPQGTQTTQPATQTTPPAAQTTPPTQTSNGAMMSMLLPNTVSVDRAHIALWPTDKNGYVVGAPSANRDDYISIVLPLVCVDGPIKNIEVAPVVSTMLDSFPFNVTKQDYTEMRGGQLVTATYDASNRQIVTNPNDSMWELTYYFQLSHNVTSGVKQVDFRVRYIVDDGTNTMEEVTFSVFVTVVKGKSTSSGGGSSVPQFVPEPKVIVNSYKFDTEKQYAGEAFTLKLSICNTSSETVNNIQVHISDETGNVLPANNGSNSLHMQQLEAGETHVEEFKLQAVPDAEARAYMMKVDFSYDGVTSKKSYTSGETIAIPVLQKIRVKCDTPVVYGDPWIDQACSMAVQMFNMGKSTIYNCMVDVAGQGLKMEETYFGGNISAGGTMRADFNIIPSVSGQIDAAIVITYEDVYGEQMEQRLPFELYVNEQMQMEPVIDDPGMIDEPVSASGGMTIPWYLWVGAALLLVTGIVVLGVQLKKHRRRELEDL